ncbi:MAG: hypothetical protein N2444_04980 [Methylocystis sp.]|nr:hypothetical protein [Methylocystis sp.]
MSWRRKPRKDPEENDLSPIIAASFFLSMSVLSFWIKDERIADMIRGSGIISAAFCVIYYFVALLK